MADGILFIVLPEGDVAKVQDLVRRSIVPARRDSVRILSDACAGALTSDIKFRTTQQLIALISNLPQHHNDRLLIGHETDCGIKDLQAWWRTRGQRDPASHKLKPRAIERALQEHLESSGAHWRTHAMTELEAFDGPRPNLQAWLQQFGELGFTDVGRKIAAKLRVIRTSKLPSAAFAMRTTDALGHRQAACYIEDHDRGGSWVDMQALLVHSWPPGTVFPIRWDEAGERLAFPKIDVDELVIHEDGLWSGKEAIKRLEAIQAAPPSALVTFRFGVVTDFGLMVVRHAIRSFGLAGRVAVDATASELIHFLKRDIPEPLRHGLHLPNAEYFAELQRHVEPSAFVPSEDWPPEELSACENLGAQLVRAWISRANGGVATSENVGLFALGGGRFASTVLFSRSIPKVCLPLLWLDGDVQLQGKTLKWKPLFLDARRISDGTLLLAP